MNAKPDVSVVIPTRDRWPLLERTLDGALRQEDVALEVIVVDDGSTDGTSRRLLDVGAGRVRVVRHDVNLGLAKARNAGIAEARGPWLAFLDDDDVWSPRKLRTQLEAVKAAGASFGYSSVALLNEAGRIVGLESAPAPGGLLAVLLRRNVIPAGASSVIARTDVVRRLGGFDEALSHLADWDMWIRLASAGSAAACPETLVGYVQHPGSMLISHGRGVVAELTYVASKHRELAAREGVDVDIAAFARWTAGAHRRAGRRLPAARDYIRATGIEVRRGNSAGVRASMRGAVASIITGRPAYRSRTADELQVAAPAWLGSYRSGARP